MPTPSPSQLPASAPAPEETRTLIDDLLAEQRTSTAVEAFARAHDRHEISEPRYRMLLPTTAPAPGQQYAFEVNLDQCSGCKACVTACHSLNGLDEDETWRSVGRLTSTDWRSPLQQTVTTACHHCVDPGCLNGCPVLAYEKDPMTGIVRHLDDQCIGCQYCLMMCPYDVPQYSAARGIVRKCDLCSQRLAVGEAPACVQACPNEAIRITVVATADIAARFRPTSVETSATPWLPAAPDPALTLPTTRYVSRQPLVSHLVPADAAEISLQPAHWPLVWMLVLTQLSVGAFAVALWLNSDTRAALVWLALGSGLLGIAASTSHLGHPLKAWRSFLGLKRSWLSREIVVFGGFAVMAAVATVCVGLASTSWFSTAALVATALLGLIGAVCSGMIYHATQRAGWRGMRSVGRFLGTTALLGLAAAWAMTAMAGHSVEWFPVTLALATAIKLAAELRFLRLADSSDADEVWPREGQFDPWSLARSAVLMRDRLGVVLRVRIACGVLGGLILPLLSALPERSGLALAMTSLLLCFAGELAERYLFFRAIVPPRMPGS